MTARIFAISEKNITVLPAEKFECFGCLEGECKKRPAPITVENRGSMKLQPGQLVETSLPASALFGEGSVAIIPPLLGFLAGFFLVRFFYPAAGDAACAAAGVLFLFAIAAAAYFIRRRFPPKTRLVIKRVLDTF